MRNKFFFKVLFGYLFLATFFSLTTLLVEKNFSRKQKIKIVTDNIKSIVDAIESVVENSPGIEKETKLEKIINEIDKKTGVRITIILSDGKVFIDSERNASFMENHSDRPEFKKAIETGYGTSIRWSPTLNRYMVYYAKKSSNFVIRGSLGTGKVAEITTILSRRFYITLSILLIAGLMFSFVISHLLYLPVKEILEFTERLKSGSQVSPSITGRKDETGKIMQNIAEISAKTIDLEEKEKIARSILNQFIDTLDFPASIINKDGDITICNKSFITLFEIEEKHGLWWEKIKNFDINRLINNTIENGQKIEREIRIKDSYYVGKSLLLSEKKDVLFILIDITAIKNIEQGRREFLTAVSHELKTPLTAIKGYIETLVEETKDPQQQKYIEIILYNTERMEKILEDIITISRIENPNIKLEMEKVDIVKIAKNVISLFEKKATQKGLNIQLKYDEIPQVTGDEFRIEQMLINLLDNAIRYTEKGIIEILLIYRQETKTIKIEVADTGIGIGKEHLSKIFEKFYVVDKARSRLTGGTGLGLSIVRSIVLQHNGNIEVESSPGKGTKFIITLPA
ncbi:MAG: ATP-binding protein [Candidatus Omnitrophica bacterium]|nr:ATP-binding protein [Candidatus Omnitrophota bacterium]